jgi:uncharacterized protein YbaR (Trm112 family)
MELIVDKRGRVRCIYAESIHLAAIGRIDIRRASHVEPTTEGTWTADMAPVAGPVLGPFAARGEALAAEHEWLIRNWLDGAAASHLVCPHCGGRQFAYAEYVQRMYRRCDEENGVLVCHTASDELHWDESKDAMLCCRQCGQKFPVPQGCEVDFV